MIDVFVASSDDALWVGVGKLNDTAKESRIGHGFDVHGLVRGRRLTIGGVEIPTPRVSRVIPF